MSDLVIRQADGWNEITELVEHAVAGGWVNMNEIWRMASQNRTEDIEGSLRTFAEINDFFGKKMSKAFRVVMVPDDMRGEYMRIWVTLGRVAR